MIWMTAGIGMTVGVELYILAIGTIFLVVFFQCVLHLKNPYFQTKQSYAYCIKFNKITTEEQDIDKLPQNTSLRKKYIDYVKSGKKSGWATAHLFIRMRMRKCKTRF